MGYIFQQDGHTTPGTISFISQKAKALFGWPPNSPDMSPIENLWAIMKHRLDDEMHQPKDRNGLKKLLLIVYDGASMETINALIYSFEYRLSMCIDVEFQYGLNKR